MAVGAAAIAYYVYSRTRRDINDGVVETHRHVEHAPQNWTGELYLFAEALRYLYLEYITQWQAADLFIGVFYLARQGIRDFPAAEVVAHGTRVNPKSLDRPHAMNLKAKFEIMYRLLIYSQKLRNTSVEIPEDEWIDLEIGPADFVVYRPKASMLRPAYVIVKDPILDSFVLAIRGTHTTRDIFTSLSGAAKPHHYIDKDGLVLGYSHIGMLAGARWLFKHCKEALLSAHEAQPDFKLLVTGHSMGGGAAAMLTMMIREQLPQFGDVQCYTFACPGCMTLELAKSCAPYVTSLIYGTDVVPTVSPGAGDLLREQVAQSSWGKSFKQDIRSSAFVQGIETRVKGVYRSASTWTLRQARTVSSLTTQCVRPRDRRSSQSMVDLCNAEFKDLAIDDSQRSKADDSLLEEPDSSYSAEEAGTSTATEKAVQEGGVKKSGIRAGYFSEMWSKMSSFSWRRKVSDATASNSEVGDNVGEVEGVFNAQGLEDDGETEAADESMSNASKSNAKRLLYPAGQIFHLVPEYILKADPTREEAPSEDDASSTEHDSTTWYRPHAENRQDEEESAFVLFSDMPQEAYGKIRVCRSMVMDHFVPRYKIALKSAIQDLDSVLDDETTHHI